MIDFTPSKIFAHLFNKTAQSTGDKFAGMSTEKKGPSSLLSPPPIPDASAGSPQGSPPLPTGSSPPPLPPKGPPPLPTPLASILTGSLPVGSPIPPKGPPPLPGPSGGPGNTPPPLPTGSGKGPPPLPPSPPPIPGSPGYNPPPTPGKGPPPVPNQPWGTPPPIPGAQTGQKGPPPFTPAQQQTLANQASQANQATTNQAMTILGISGSEKAAKAVNLAQLGGRAAAGDPTAMVQLAQEVKKGIEEKLGHLKGIGTEAGQALKSEKFGDIGAHASNAGIHLGEFIGGPAGMIISKLSEFSKFLFESVDKLRDWNNTLHNSNMRFAEFSASMAQVNASQQMRDIQLSAERGERRAKSADYLAESKSRLEQKITPWEDAWADVKNYLAGNVSNLLTKMMTDINAIAVKIGILNPDAPNPSKGRLIDAFSDAHERNWPTEIGRPNRF